MKVFNEKTVASLPTSMRPDIEGYLYKRGGEYSNSFKKRYFVLLSNLLFYYERRGDKEPLGVIVLEGHILELCDDSERQNTFIIRYSDEAVRQYVLAADSTSEMTAWMRALVSAGVDYSRITLQELEIQLQRDCVEIPEMTEVTPLRSPGAEGVTLRENPFGDTRFRVTVHFPTFRHFHEAIEAALSADHTPQSEKRKPVILDPDDLITF